MYMAKELIITMKFKVGSRFASKRKIRSRFIFKATEFGSAFVSCKIANAMSRPRSWLKPQRGSENPDTVGTRGPKRIQV
jgi:hypothetical protein